jgi:hypothetical protein
MLVCLRVPSAWWLTGAEPWHSFGGFTRGSVVPSDSVSDGRNRVRKRANRMLRES